MKDLFCFLCKEKLKEPETEHLCAVVYVSKEGETGIVFHEDCFPLITGKEFLNSQSEWTDLRELDNL